MEWVFKLLFCFQHLVSPTFSALLWINPVASLLEGQSRSLAKDQEILYSVVSNKIEKLDEAICIAKEYATSHLGKKSHVGD